MGTLIESVLSESEIKNLLQSVIKEEGITNEKYHVSKGFEKGDGYMSFVIKVDVIGNKNLHLVIKCAPKSPEFRKAMPVNLCFAREIYFYEEVYPALLKFQKEKNVKNPFKCVAKCYKSLTEECRELLVLQNIKEEGFRLWNRKLVMDDAHVSFVLKEYGKFHASSFALKQQNRQKFDELTSSLTNIFSMEISPKEIFELFINLQEKTKKLFSSEKEKLIYARLAEFKDEILDFFKYIDVSPGKYGMILHGDCWCNNMMFKYGDTLHPEKPTDLFLLDFQIVRVASPVFDLSYFFYAGASKENLDRLDHYLRLYYNSFKQHMKDLGGDPDEYSFEALKSDWKMYAKFGYLLSQVVFKAMLRDEDEVVDSTDGDGGDFLSAFQEDIRSEYIDERLKNLSLHMYENGFL